MESSQLASERSAVCIACGSDEVEPFLDRNANFTYVGSPSVEVKAELLSKARALLVPSLVEETSSLVSLEAMACGTPVIAFARGALPEVVIDAVTGLIVDSVDAMAAAVGEVDLICPHRCREHVKRNHQRSRMGQDYEQIYEAILCPARKKERAMVFETKPEIIPAV